MRQMPRKSTPRVIRGLVQKKHNWDLSTDYMGLMHLYELGRHHDRMTTRSQKQSCRGEPFAEEYAVQYEARIWDAFTRAFAF
jgi:hypothetical protein